MAKSKVTISTYAAEGKMKAKSKLYSANTKKVFKETSQTIAKGDNVIIACKSSNGYYYIVKDDKGKVGLWVKQKAVTITRNKILGGTQRALANQRASDYKSLKNDFKQIKKTINHSTIDTSKLMVRTLNGIHGAPYQFMHSCDAPIDSRIMFGRKYIERIVTKMPLLLMSPGTPDFLPAFSKKKKSNVLKLLVSSGGIGANIKNNVKALLGDGSGRYYTFKFDYSGYYKYVNAMLNYCAVCLGVSKVKHAIITTNIKSDIKLFKESSTKFKKSKSYEAELGSFRWEKAANFDIVGTMSSKEYVAFYLDSETSISETFSNSTTTPSLAASFESGITMSKEIQFLAGGVAGIRLKPMDIEGYNSSKSQLTKTVEKHLGKGSSKLMGHLDEIFQTVGRGGRIIFPEIWDDSEFSRSYSVSLKLRTPDGDKLSWFLNICVPLIHLISLAAPRALGPNGYKSPYIVRAYYKGIFNCDMGMITSMSVTKGKDAAWTVDGLPTEVDVSLDIKELYGKLTISDNSNKSFLPSFKFFKNTCLIDYLSNMCGVNINKPELSRLSEAYILFAKNKYKNAGSDAWLSFENKASNVLDKMYQKALFKL